MQNPNNFVNVKSKRIITGSVGKKKIGTQSVPIRIRNTEKYNPMNLGELPADPFDLVQLQHWIQQVDQQRQLIQSREYWSIRQAYASSGV